MINPVELRDKQRVKSDAHNAVRPIVRWLGIGANISIGALALAGIGLAAVGQSRLMVSDEAQETRITAPFDPAKADDTALKTFGEDLHHQGHIQKESGLELLVVALGMYAAKKKVEGNTHS